MSEKKIISYSTGKHSDPIYERLKNNFPDFFPRYWIFSSVRHYRIYQAKQFFKSYNQKKEKEFDDEIKILNQIIGGVNSLMKLSAGYGEINYMVNKKLQGKGKNFYKEINEKSKIDQLPSRTKETYYKDIFLINLYLSIYQKYWRNNKHFPKQTFIRFLNEIWYYFGLIQDVCFEEKTQAIRFVWIKGTKTFFRQKTKFKNTLVKCGNYSTQENICKRLIKTSTAQQFCFQINESGFNYIENRLKVVLKKLKQDSTYYILVPDNKSFLSRYLT